MLNDNCNFTFRSIMSRARNAVLVILLSFVQVHAMAQTNDGVILSQADAAYESGRFELADSLLRSSIAQMNGDERLSAYRILALCNIQLERMDIAEEYVGMLLDEAPDYVNYDDSPRFIDIVERLKKNSTKISTASRMAERLEESPVPITLITEDMIKLSGAKTINELLMIFVPGMSRTSNIVDNVNLRGITGIVSQESMQVMLDGHNMNSFLLNSALLDFSQNLDKIKQIEVLRGAAATSNSNAAITAVINIITKTGMDISKIETSGKLGKDNTIGFDLMCGDGNLTGDIIGWLSFYNTHGEAVTEDGITSYIEGFRSPPAIDLGGKFRWGDFKFEASMSSSLTVPYQNMYRLANSYSYDRYPVIYGIGPGLYYETLLLSGDFSHQSGNTTYSAGFSFIKHRMQLYNVLCDSLSEDNKEYIDKIFDLNIIPQGIWQFFSLQTVQQNGYAMMSHNYTLKDGAYGSFQAGINGNLYSADDNSMMYGYDFRTSPYYTENNLLLSQESEYSLSAYLMLKHYFTKHFLLNGGVSYDYRYCISQNSRGHVSPRLSLIWNSGTDFSIRGSFCRSVVDAPYFYRIVTFEIVEPFPGLEPTSMNSFQLTGSGRNKSGLSYEANLFYNDIYKRVRFYNSSNKLFWSSTEQFYANSGHIKIGGIEGTFQYNTDRTFVNSNLTYQYQFDFEHFANEHSDTGTLFNIDEHIHDMENVPNFIFNATAGQYIFKNRKAGALRLHANMHVQSSYYYAKFDFTDQLIGNHEEMRQPAVALFNAGAEWNTDFGLSLTVNAYNLFNTKYVIGSQFSGGVPNRGFHVICDIGYKFGSRKKRNATK